MNRHRVLTVVYLVLSIVGLVGTWWFNLSFFASGGQDYLGGWFANDASSSAAVDILVAGAFTFPLFLALR